MHGMRTGGASRPAKNAAVVEFVSRPNDHTTRIIAIERNGLLFGALWCDLARPDRLWLVSLGDGREREFVGSFAFHSALLWAEQCADDPARK